MLNKICHIIGWIWGRIPVRIMDYEHDEYVTFVKRMPDNTYKGTLYWFPICHGDITLLPGGFVSPACATPYCYVWQPLNKSMQVELALAYDWPNWETWRHMDHTQMGQARHIAVARHLNRP